MSILIEFGEKKPVKHDTLGDIIISELEKDGFSLYYNDVYDVYSTIDFRKDGYKYNVMLIQKEKDIECSTFAYRNIFPIIFKKYNKEKQSSFYNLVESILIQKEFIKRTLN